MTVALKAAPITTKNALSMKFCIKQDNAQLEFDKAINVRRFDLQQDLSICLQIWRRSAAKGHPFLTSAELDAEELVLADVYMPMANVSVVTLQEKPTGFIALIENEIGGLFIDPDFWGNRLGSLLVSKAFDVCPILNVEVYAANNRALSFYSKLGFIEIGKRSCDDHGRLNPLLKLSGSR